MGCLESLVTQIEVTAEIAGLENFHVFSAMPAFFRFALTTAAEKFVTELPAQPTGLVVSKFVISTAYR